jgi:hypothetical protein
MSLERLIGIRKFWLLSWHYHCNYGTKLALHWNIKSKPSVLYEGLSWVGKEALVGIRCLTINTQSNRVVIVSSIITRISLTLCKYWTVTFQPISIKTLMIYLFCEQCLSANYYCVLLLLLFYLLFIFVRLLFSVFIQLFCLYKISLFTVHRKNIQFWSWIVFQVFRSRNCATSSSESINIIHHTAPSWS